MLKAVQRDGQAVRERGSKLCLRPCQFRPTTRCGFPALLRDAQRTEHEQHDNHLLLRLLSTEPAAQDVQLFCNTAHGIIYYTARRGICIRLAKKLREILKYSSRCPPDAVSRIPVQLDCRFRNLLLTALWASAERHVRLPLGHIDRSSHHRARILKNCDSIRVGSEQRLFAAIPNHNVSTHPRPSRRIAGFREDRRIARFELWRGSWHRPQTNPQSEEQPPFVLWCRKRGQACRC